MSDGLRRITGTRLRGLTAAAALGCTTAMLLWAHASSAGAGPTGITVHVNSTASSSVSGDGHCTLAEAIAFSTGTVETDCTSAAPNGITTIDLPAGHYKVASTLAPGFTTKIIGAGAGKTTIDGHGSVEVLSVASGTTVSISGVKITGGASGDATTGCATVLDVRTCPAEDGNSGGGIYNAGTLKISHAIITGNTASAGALPFGVHSACLDGCAGESAGDGGSGGGIYNTGTLKIEHSTVSDNDAGDGGNGTAAVTGIDASAGDSGGQGGSGGWGGGIYNTGTLKIAASTISGNAAGRGGNGGAGGDSTASSGDGGDAGQPGAGGWGGGIYSTGALKITGSTISGNAGGHGGNGATGGAATGSGTDGSSSFDPGGGPGGGLYLDGGAAALTNVTIAGNVAPDNANGGAFWDYLTGVTLSFVTVAHNSAPAIGNGGGMVTETDSIVALNKNATTENCTGSITDGGGNVTYRDGPCPGQVVNPRLGKLAQNGGPTKTIRLLAGSPAIDTIPAADCPVHTDERGVSRPQGKACDAGAYEVAPPALSHLSAKATGPQSAQITGHVAGHLTATKLTITYGTKAAHGSKRSNRLRASGTSVAFTVRLKRLRPHTTYRLKVVASNRDGTTSSKVLKLTTKQPR